MTGHLYAFGPCYVCRAVFGFSPTLVPSVVVDGDRKPICRACVEQVNPEREAKGLAPITPLPGAYAPEEA